MVTAKPCRINCTTSFDLRNCILGNLEERQRFWLSLLLKFLSVISPFEADQV